jgi:hypothetical protein
VTLVRESMGVCTHVPLISTAGVGRWWRCELIVSAIDGRRLAGLSRPSAVSLADQGRSVILVERCTASAEAAGA